MCNCFSVLALLLHDVHLYFYFDYFRYHLSFQNARLINANIRTAKYLAAITLGFFTAVSPWTLCTLIIVAANVQLDETVDYSVTWLALSNSFWNCLIYGVMNRKFRMAAARFACGRCFSSVKENVTDSKDFSEEESSRGSSAYSKYMLRQSQRKSKRNALNHELNVSSSTVSTPRLTPADTPCNSPQITKKPRTGFATDI